MIKCTGFAESFTGVPDSMKCTGFAEIFYLNVVVRGAGVAKAKNHAKRGKLVEGSDLIAELRLEIMVRVMTITMEWKIKSESSEE